jgi:CheY-like chemotaxis protein
LTSQRRVSFDDRDVEIAMSNRDVQSAPGATRVATAIDLVRAVLSGATDARAAGMRLLLAEDDALLSRSLAKGLRERSYAVDVVSDGDAAVTEAAVTDYDGIVLDVLLPGRDGFAVARALRERGIATPILMLTSRDRVADKIAGLDAGADDYKRRSPYEQPDVPGTRRVTKR